MRELPPKALLAEIEHGALALAKLAGAAIELALERELAVRYKGASDGDQRFHDPVSDVDEEVELLLLSHLRERFPDHDVLGEEQKDSRDRGGEFVWAIDPVDGTTNFVNGFPLFACSIGVLFRGRPVCAAMWCATSHALRPGVYHAHAGGSLCFESASIGRRPNASVRRRLAGMPGGHESAKDDPWEVRTTGSAAIECAFVASGLLEVARFGRPNVWDVAAGILLVQAAGGVVLVEDDRGFKPFDGFATSSGETGARALRGWRAGVVCGDPRAVARVTRRPTVR